MKRLRRMAPTGPKDVVNVDKTVYETMRNAGEIEIIFDRRLADRLKVILLIDNGGWSMDPYIEVVQTLFHYASSQFKDLKIYFFHNTIYSRVWADPQRYYKPQEVDDFIRWDPETRVIIVGDANMAPYELVHPNGAIYIDAKQTGASLERLKFLARTFRHCVWLNPMSLQEWYLQQDDGDNPAGFSHVRAYSRWFGKSRTALSVCEVETKILYKRQFEAKRKNILLVQLSV